MVKPLMETNFPDLKLFKKGKVRDTYDLGNGLLLMVATDRISTYDCVHPTGIPDKGKILTQLSTFWFNFLKDICSNHLMTWNIDRFPDSSRKYRDILRGRSMLIQKTEVIPIECVVRGYLYGSGWREYQEKGTVCGIQLPKGLKQADKLPEPIFTPATKAKAGHDENITVEEAKRMVGKESIELLESASLTFYRRAADYTLNKGIIIADTKFEFGWYDGTLMVVDELLTPDSSRFWPADQYKPGGKQPNFDKQFVRDYVSSIGWNKKPPAPELPEGIVKETRRKYIEVFELLTGKSPEL